MQTSTKKVVLKYCAALAVAIALLLIELYVVLPVVSYYFAWRLPENYEFIADALVERGKIARAEKIVRTATKRRPWDFRPQQNLGELLLKDNKRSIAIAHLTIAAELAFKAAVYPDMLSPYHRKRLGSLYFTLAKELNAAQSARPEVFYFTYAAILNPTLKKKCNAVIRSMVKQGNLSIAKRYVVFRHFSILGGEKLVPEFTTPTLSPILATQSDGQLTTGALEGFLPFINRNLIIENQNATPRNGIYIFFRTGEIKYQLTQGQATDTTLWILARGTPAFGIYPIVDLWLDGHRIAFIYADSTQWRFYPIQITVPQGGHTFSLKYLNDGGFPAFGEDGKIVRLIEDRNLFYAGIYVRISRKGG